MINLDKKNALAHPLHAFTLPRLSLSKKKGPLLIAIYKREKLFCVFPLETNKYRYLLYVSVGLPLERQ